MRASLFAAALPAAFLAAAGATAHDGVIHSSEAEAKAHLKATAEGADALPSGPVTPFPVDLDVRFDLVDQTGTRRTEADFAGQPMVIFFGYANCEAICSVALPRLAAAVDILGENGAALQPILITVDPARDTPEAMATALPEIHPRLIGLTGDVDRLADARAAFQVEAKVVTTDPDGQPIYAHGSFIYLIGSDGELATLLPPILSPERMAAVMERYITAD